MQLNNSINNAQPSFNARLYLQNINKKDLDFFKGIAKDFHIGTTAIKGKSYTLTDIGDKLVLTSNPNKRNFGSIYKKDMNTIIKKQGREGFLNQLKTMAHAIKAFDLFNETAETLDKINKNPKAKAINISKTFKGHMNMSELNKFAEEFTAIVKKMGIDINK